MPRYRAIAPHRTNPDGLLISIHQKGHTVFPTRFVRPDEQVPDDFFVAALFDAVPYDARRVFLEIATRGVATGAADKIVYNEGADDGTSADRYWRFNGDSGPLNRAMADFGLDIPLKRLNAAPAFREVTNLVNQVQTRYHKARKENGVAVLYPADLAQVTRTLAEADRHVAEMAVVTAAAGRVIDDARRAFGIDTARTFTLPAAATQPDEANPEPPLKHKLPRKPAGA